jgi:putative ABC transport system substrate-binding protein
MKDKRESMGSPTARFLARGRGRRGFLVGGIAASWPGISRSQPSKAPVRIGHLTAGSNGPEAGGVFIDAFRDGLRELGYHEGQNLVLDCRAADGNPASLSRLARELVGSKPSIFLAMDTPAARALKRETATIPIVVSVLGDPVGDGLAESLARPGGNVTGLSFIGPLLAPKRLAMLREMLPKASRVAALVHPAAYTEETTRGMIADTIGAARALSIELQLLSANTPAEVGTELAKCVESRPDALFVFPSTMLFSERKQIVDFAIAQGLPLNSMGREFVQIGGLMSYGASISALNRRSALYVDRILRGANPAELPIEQPTSFEMAINLRTARKLGLTVPPALLASADAIFE